MKMRWFVHFIRRAVRQRLGRVLVASLAVTIATGMVSAAIGLSMGIGRKLGGELRAYGANIIVSPGPQKGGAWLRGKDAEAIRSLDGVEEASGQLYLRGIIEGRAEVEVIGLQPESLKGWRMTGRLPGEKEALAGVDIKEALGLKEGDFIRLALEAGSYEMRVSGFVERGGAEDGALLVGLGELQRISGLEGRLSAVLVRGRAGGLEDTAQKIMRAVPGAEVKTVRQVALAEESFLGKIKLLMLLVSLVVVPASGISVSSTMSATVIERRKEIGLMMAIGGTRAEVGFFYLAEAALIGLFGGVLGFLTGFAASQAVSKGAFGSYIEMPAVSAVISVALGIFISLVSSAAPLRGALGERPSVILRGE